jgi:hypothetical protein
MAGYWSASNDVYDELPEGVSCAALGVYGYLCRKANAEGVSWPSLATICKTLRISVNSARRYLAQLEAAGMLVVSQRESHEGAHSYQILNHIGSGKASKPYQNLIGSNEETYQNLTEPCQNLNQPYQNLTHSAEVQPYQNLTATVSKSDTEEYPYKNPHGPSPTGKSLTPPTSELSGASAEEIRELFPEPDPLPAEPDPWNLLPTPEAAPLPDAETPAPVTRPVVPPRPAPRPRATDGAKQQASAPLDQPAPEPAASEPPAADFTTKAAFGFACEQCKTHFRAEFIRLGRGPNPVLTPRDKKALMGALEAIREADGGDWQTVEAEAKRLLTLFLADESDRYVADLGWALHTFNGQMQKLRNAPKGDANAERASDREAAIRAGSGQGSYRPTGTAGRGRGSEEDRARRKRLVDQWVDPQWRPSTAYVGPDPFCDRPA